MSLPGARGATVTKAAHEAGFADGAHFTRTFASRPSDLTGSVRWIVEPSRP